MAIPFGGTYQQELKSTFKKFLLFVLLLLFSMIVFVDTEFILKYHLIILTPLLAILH